MIHPLIRHLLGLRVLELGNLHYSLLDNKQITEAPARANKHALWIKRGIKRKRHIAFTQSWTRYRLCPQTRACQKTPHLGASMIIDDTELFLSRMESAHYQSCAKQPSKENMNTELQGKNNNPPRMCLTQTSLQTFITHHRLPFPEWQDKKGSHTIRKRGKSHHDQ